MKITTKEVFQWNKDTEKYDSIECESYEYSGDLAECGCQTSDSWWFGKNSLWCTLAPDEFSYGGATARFNVGDAQYQFAMSPTTVIPAEEDFLKYGIIAVAAYMLLKK